eukprot:TRINITY_DN248_c0_g1_i2.p1 TRINITY_DN248_c0_g1~~TRINITY_DN248_c0_g1_i2.p1  ORF type:complete len:101 (-),score=23.83 TRINITY_DN248_c0_g1_i2:458-760(-)
MTGDFTAELFALSMLERTRCQMDALHRSLRKTPLILQKIENSPLQPDLLEHLAQVGKKVEIGFGIGNGEGSNRPRCSEVVSSKDGQGCRIPAIAAHTRDR